MRLSLSILVLATCLITICISRPAAAETCIYERGFQSCAGDTNITPQVCDGNVAPDGTCCPPGDAITENGGSYSCESSGDTASPPKVGTPKKHKPRSKKRPAQKVPRAPARQSAIYTGKSNRLTIEVRTSRAGTRLTYVKIKAATTCVSGAVFNHEILVVKPNRSVPIKKDRSFSVTVKSTGDASYSGSLTKVTGRFGKDQGRILGQNVKIIERDFTEGLCGFASGVWHARAK